MKYAAQTQVSVDRSRSEIEKTLNRFGAESFIYGWEGSKAAIRFEMNGKRIRYTITLPDRNDPQFTHTEARATKRHPADALAQWEKACRVVWRELALIIKAKLVAIDSGVSTFEEEFLSRIELPGYNGATAGDWLIPQIDKIYETGKLPPMLALPAPGKQK